MHLVSASEAKFAFRELALTVANIFSLLTKKTEAMEKVIIFILSLIYFNDDVVFRHNCKHRRYKITTMVSGDKRKICKRCSEVFD